MQTLHHYLNHRQQILHSISYHPARRNGIPIVLTDNLATPMRKVKIMMDNVFELLEYDDHGVIYSVTHPGI